MTKNLCRPLQAAAASVLAALTVVSVGATPAEAATVTYSNHLSAIEVIPSAAEIQQAAVSVAAADAVCRAGVLPSVQALGNPTHIDSTQCAIQLNYWSQEALAANRGVLIRFSLYTTTGYLL